ncbi:MULTISPECIES: adenylate/guanylate cyclase domain-containing protein [Bacillaceae]|uniref:adenylate/guanylate cyclase domain-containing protein n=1 Tax=Bacillaceae TaxID=186817 RepID=UPI001780F951|nr:MULTISPECIES: adenylate/guanylate cyclase domain-containing protein [Bacillaceae]MBT2679552.1 adenylate/guanylate cyclase domain-containing protein [Bacillus sp. ISL-35]MBT2703455.1 adenylate/guanylate cyclase domain-containing protein [Chryseobacterium sp. ISL-80]UYZ19943.1 adenylate/guanylate cyclase domain-containing protein [Mesobacillus jeotgali]
MGKKDSITKKVKEIMDTNFVVEDVDYVPDIDDKKLTFGNKGVKFEATVLHIDMRGSTGILNNHNKSTVAKIHMAYFHTITTLAHALGGSVRSFNGDSMLVYFPGTSKNTLSSAVQAAMQMKYMISHEESGINKLLSKYSAIDFGIGLDDGKILCTKIGIGGDLNNKGLFWAGNAVNKAVRLSDLAKAPNHICISRYVYHNLNDNVKFHTRKNIFGVDEKINMWNSESFTYNGKQETFYFTNYRWSVL